MIVLQMQTRAPIAWGLQELETELESTRGDLEAQLKEARDEIEVRFLTGQQQMCRPLWACCEMSARQAAD